MPVSGVVISLKNSPDKTILDSIASVNGVEVHSALEDDRVIAVIDSDSVNCEIDAVKKIMDIDGVLDVRLAYHNFEDLQ